MSDIYGLFGISIEEFRQKPAAVELAKTLKKVDININQLSETETNDILACFLLATR